MSPPQNIVKSPLQLPSSLPKPNTEHGVRLSPQRRPELPFPEAAAGLGHFSPHNVSRVFTIRGEASTFFSFPPPVNISEKLE